MCHKLLTDRILVHILQLSINRFRHHLPVLQFHFQCHVRYHIRIACRIYYQYAISFYISHLCTSTGMVMPYQHDIKAGHFLSNVHRRIFHHTAKYVA